MKIRHKQSGVELEGEFCECATGNYNFPTRYYFMACGDNSQYDMAEWEAVAPDTKWVDVTEECLDHEGKMIVHNDYARFAANAVGDGYRLRKIPVWVGDLSLKPRYAFIIERKEPA